MSKKNLIISSSSSSLLISLRRCFVNPALLLSLSTFQTLTPSSAMAGSGEELSSVSSDTTTTTTDNYSIDPDLVAQLTDDKATTTAAASVVDPTPDSSQVVDPKPDSSKVVDEKTTTAAVVVEEEDEDVKYGFKRSEMFTTPLSGTLEPYHRHVFLCYKNAKSWVPNIDGEVDSLSSKLRSKLKYGGDKITGKTKLTVCEAPAGTDSSDGDVLVFPEMMKYKGLTNPAVDTFVEDVMISKKNWVSGSEPLEGSYIFVCSHGSRDRRCGVCGPALIEKFKEEIELRGLKDRVFVTACSHVGGHKYAGNLIVFSPDSAGKITGHWYGYVAPEDVPVVLDQHIGKGIIIEKLWRGQMVALSEVNDKVNEPNPQVNGGLVFAPGTTLKTDVGGRVLPNGTIVKIGEEEAKRSTEGETMKDAGSCCQGASGFSCCRDEKVEAKDVVKTAEAIKTNALDRVSAWMKNWDRSEVLAATAVASAVASVAVGYSLYRRSG